MSDLLILVEDPGAANFAAALPAGLRALGYDAELHAFGHALAQLRQLGVTCRAAELTPEALLRTSAARAVAVGTAEDPDCHGLALIDLARRHALVSIGLVDGPANADLRFRGRGSDPLRHAPDWLAVPDGGSVRHYVELGFPLARIAACGHPHFDRVRREGEALHQEGREAVRRRLFPNAGRRPILVFLAELSDGLVRERFRRGSAYTLVGRGNSARTEVVLEEVLDALSALAERPYVVLRLHPKNADDDYAAYAGEVEAVSRNEPALDVVYAADLVVGLSTVLLDEAAILGRPTLAVLPRALEAGWLQSVQWGATVAVSERAALQRWLPRLIAGEGLGQPVALPPPGAEARLAAFVAGILSGRTQRLADFSLAVGSG
jgi:hypothetical protein